MSPSHESFVPAGAWRRWAAVVMLAALAASGPAVVHAVIGTPIPEVAVIRGAWRTGRLDDAAVVQIGALLFLVLWAWFLASAASEAWHVLRWRSAPRRMPLPAITPSPTGWVRHLVRVALVSSTAIAASGLAPLHARSHGVPAASASSGTAAILSIADPGDPWSARTVDAPGPTIVARNRDTPYAVAARLGDPSLRQRIIELNTGRPGPDGAAWTGGVFPTGMSVVVPDDVASRARAEASPTWMPYTVHEGDTVYSIAASLTSDDHRAVTQVADQIIRHNLGRAMPDGRTFADASLIVTGWVLDVPAASPTPVDGHVVVAGDSYWKIAADRLTGTGAEGPADVARLTSELRSFNAPLLGHDDPNLILPGEIVRWADDPAVAPTAVAEPAVTEPAVIVVDLPPVPFEPIVVDVVPRAPLPRDLPPPVLAESAPAPPAPDVLEPSAPAPAPAPAPIPEATARADDGSSVPAPLGVGAAAFVCVGAVALLESRRREQLRRATSRSVPHVVTDEHVRIETAIRSCTAGERVARLELGLRSCATSLADHERHVLAATVAEDGAVRLAIGPLDLPAPTPVEPWVGSVDDRWWCLPASVGLADLAPAARRSSQPCPALVHLGIVAGDEHDGAELFVDLEAIGLLEVLGPSPAAHDIGRAITAAIAVSPVSETIRGITVGLDDDTHLGNPNLESAAGIDAALDLAASYLGSTGTIAAGRRTFSLRTRGGGPDAEAWEPVVVVAVGSASDRDEVASLTRAGGRGLGVVLVTDPVSAQAGSTGGWVMRHVRDATWLLDPLGVRLLPIGLAVEQMVKLGSLLDAASAPFTDAGAADVLDEAMTDLDEPTWALLVHLLGRVEVTDADGAAVSFGRSKALELTAWLALHRDRPTRTAARTALWELDVRPETFANVVSDARRAMARCVPPPEDGEWIERTMTEHLPLHPLVVTDADLLRARLEHARHLPSRARADVLRPGVELVTGLPFAGTDYLWPHAEGLTSSLLLLATSAATELARCYLETGDVEGVFWATGRGLRVVPGHEELIALRMRAHAQQGDLAGVRSEWEVYERALHADPWSAAEPSPKLAAVRRELLSS